MRLSIVPAQVVGLGDKEKEQLQDLLEVYNYHYSRNERKAKYYGGHVTVNDVNLGIALPNGIKGLSVGCEWGAKCVDVLAARSMFDGFVGQNGETAAALDGIVQNNRLISEYMKACRDELKYGCTFATLSATEDGCKIRFHSPQTAAALWNGEAGRIGCAFAIIDTVRDEDEKNTWIPSHVNLYTDTDVWEIRRDGYGRWYAEQYPHVMGRPLVEPLVWNATSQNPFGRSRLNAPVRTLIEGYVRTVAAATIGLEFSTAPQKYLLGLTDEQYDAVINDKFKQYVGSILAATPNPDTGANPTFGQLAQGSITPHVEMLRILSSQFSAATGLTVTDTGVINDANPTSADAVNAQSKTLVALAGQLNSSNGDALSMIAKMALAITGRKSLADLTAEESDVVAHFKNPSMPSVAETADAAIKIASAREGFAGTDIFLEMLGFSQADIRRLKAQEQRAKGTQILMEEFSSNANDGEGVA